jgi:hypothetical protein
MLFDKVRVWPGVALAAAGLMLLSAMPVGAQVPWGTVELQAEDVRNTKHNFFADANSDIGYDTSQTTEICVFCHTPHGGRPTDLASAVPLWNRALRSDAASTGVYTMYESPNFDGRDETGTWGATSARPVGVSLACLSCHDGTIGIDALINSPGSGGYFPPNKGDVFADFESMQLKAGPSEGIDGIGSMSEGPRPACTPGVDCVGGIGAQLDFLVGTVGTNFGMEPFPNLGTNLSDDHPISMQIPDGINLGTTADPQFQDLYTDYRETNGGAGVTWLTRTQQLNLDPRDRIRAYPSGGAGTKFVECASCHNPHTPRPLFLRLPNVTRDPGSGDLVAGRVIGVTGEQLPSGGGSVASGFLWSDGTLVSNNPNFQSAICLSCHQK